MTTFYYIQQDDKILLYDTSYKKLHDTITFMPQYQKLDILETEDEIITYNGEFVFSKDVINEQAEDVRNHLIEDINYPLKEEIAYTGVFFDFNGEELVFETNKESISLINTTLLGILQGAQQVNNWKCRKTIAPYSPVNVDFTAQQYQAIVMFGQNMITQTFAIEGEINNQIKLLTTEQLLNKEYVAGLEVQMKAAYSQVNRKFENLFPSEEVVEDQEATE